MKIWTPSLEAVSTDFGAFVRLLLVSGQRKGQWQQFRPEFMYIDKLIFPGRSNEGRQGAYDPADPIDAANNWQSFLQRMEKPTGEAEARRSVWRPWLDLARPAQNVCHKLAELGVAPHVIKRLLAHRSGVVSGIAAIYNRATYMPEMRDALQKWETRVQTILQIPEETHASHCSC